MLKRISDIKKIGSLAQANSPDHPALMFQSSILLTEENQINYFQFPRVNWGLGVDMGETGGKFNHFVNVILKITITLEK